MVGLFAELHRERIYSIVMHVVADSDIATATLGLEDTERRQIRRSFEFSRQLRRCRLKTKQAEEGVRSAKAQLRKMM